MVGNSRVWEVFEYGFIYSATTRAGVFYVLNNWMYFHVGDFFELVLVPRGVRHSSPFKRVAVRVAIRITP